MRSSPALGIRDADLAFIPGCGLPFFPPNGKLPKLPHTVCGYRILYAGEWRNKCAGYCILYAACRPKPHTVCGSPKTRICAGLILHVKHLSGLICAGLILHVKHLSGLICAGLILHVKHLSRLICPGLILHVKYACPVLLCNSHCCC